MKKIALALSVLLLSALLLPPLAKAAVSVPLTMNYQGRLLNRNNVPQSGQFVFRFSLWSDNDWDAPADFDGTGQIPALAPGFTSYQETQTVTVGSGGFFSTQIGSTTPLPNFVLSAHKYLQVELKKSTNPDTAFELLDPDGTNNANDRKIINSSPFAINADTLDNADTGTSEGNVPLLGPSGKIPASMLPSTADLDGTNADIFALDKDNSAAAEISLKFGDTLSKILKYDITNSRFEFNDNVKIGGNLEITGNIDVSGTVDGRDISTDGSTLDSHAGASSGIHGATGNVVGTIDAQTLTNKTIETLNNASLTLDNDNAGSGADVTVIANQGLDPDGTIRYNATSNKWEISNDGGAFAEIGTGTVHSQNTDTGTNSDNFTVDTDNSSGSPSLTFGTTLNKILKFDTLNGRFDFNDDLRIQGGLTVSGPIDFNQNEADKLVLDKGASFPLAPVAGQKFFRTDLSQEFVYNGTAWVSTSQPDSDVTFFFAPEYGNNVVHADGSNNNGTLTSEHDTANFRNFYQWTSTKISLNDIDLVLDITLPKDFSAFQSTPIQFNYKTDDADITDAQIDVTVLDSGNAAVTTSGATDLNNTSWTTANITFSGSPTFTAGGKMTIHITLQARRDGGAGGGTPRNAFAGILKLNYVKK